MTAFPIPGSRARPRLGGARPLALAALLICVAHPPLFGQQARDGSRWAVIPTVGLSAFGTRWGARDAAGEWRLGPDRAPAIGARLERRLSPNLALELSGLRVGSEYSLGVPDDERELAAGSLRLIRTSLGVLLRLRENVPGYFAIGAGALRYDPRERITATAGGESRPAIEDRAQWMPAAHFGAGLDLSTGGHTARLDGRLYGSRASQEFVPSAISPQLERESLALDWSVSLGYVIRF